MDEHQIQSVTRIRYVAHECLRDHVGSSALVIDNSENEVGKRIRGKERVRRRGVSKRRRKDDPDEYYGPTMSTQSQLYNSVVDVDQVQLYHVENEADPQNLCLPANNGEVDDSEYQHVAEEADVDQLSHGSEESPTVDVVQQSALENIEDVTCKADYTVTA